MSGKNKKKAETVYLVCEESGEYNYIVRRKPAAEAPLKKYCPDSASTRCTSKRKSSLFLCNFAMRCVWSAYD